jgi:hypothetical protein
MEDLLKEVCHTPTDIQENETFALSPELFAKLLIDRTTHNNILWATDNYAHLGEGYQFTDSIQIEAITGNNGNIIVPRALKNRQQQQQRSREMAEVFTPSWICNKQNNLIDTAWFGRENVFNCEVDNADGSHSWIPTETPIQFPEGKTWKDYLRDTRLEITCGEAPYLVSRYDTVTGQPIPLNQRIGLLDRKLRVVCENCHTSDEWLKAAQIAYKTTYGYEWQGDNILLAREALLMTFVDYYIAKFNATPLLKSLQYIAYIISWNIWQMDGLKGVIPGSCHEQVTEIPSLFGDVERTVTPCEGCQKGDITMHNGIQCLIRDWFKSKPKNWKSKSGEDDSSKPWQKIRFIDLIK